VPACLTFRDASAIDFLFRFLVVSGAGAGAIADFHFGPTFVGRFLVVGLRVPFGRELALGLSRLGRSFKIW
jgi:hypothetical protein